MDVIDDITSTEAESMSKIFNNPTPPAIYSLSQELLETEKELAILDKKINLGNGLLAKVNDQALISKLEKEKEGFEAQKISLSILIKKIEYINGSIKDFSLFFIFIRRFYTLAIQKENFEHRGKAISSKLIANLKAEEENLYNEYIDGDCFSKVSVILSFEPYQCYFKEYAKNFFDNIQHSSEPYMDSLLILQAVFYECTYFNINNFNLTDLKFFLSKNIPINIHLPDTNYELAALRCFFFYEILFEYLKLKPVKTNLEHLKKSVNLELNMVNYKANTKNALIYGLNDLQEALSKIDKKYNDFLGGRKDEDEDKEADVNKALVFYNLIENEIQTINRKTKSLIDNQYMNLTKMRGMLAIIVNETHLPKFLELFNTKIGNDFILNKAGRSEFIETNQEALKHLFHAICRDEFYTPLNERINLFINKLTETYSKDDTSVLDNIELEDLIEFSFYYVFTLLYTDFNANLKGFNSKLLYTELVTLSIFTNIKLKSLEVLEKRKNEEINKFFENTFKNKVEYNLRKKNIIEEIKLNLEIFQDVRRILSDTKSLENSLASKLESSLVPMPEKNLLIDSLKGLEIKQKICELECQKVEKHKFINKSKSVRLSITNEAHSKKAIEIEYSKAIENFSESLTCLSENLSECLKHIKESTQDISQFRQKISSSMGQIASSIQKLSLSLSSWKNANEIQDLTNLSLPKLLELAEKLVIKDTLITRKDHKKKLAELQELLNSSCISIGLMIDQVNLIIKKYQNCNNEAKKFLNTLSSSFVEDHNSPQFFSKSAARKVQRQINGKLSNDYVRLKEQSNWLEKLIRLIKCDTDDRVIKLYAIIVEADDYQKTYDLLNEKINFFKKIQNKTFNNSKQTLPSVKERSSSDDDKEVVLSRTMQLKVKEDVEIIPDKNLLEVHVEKIIPIFTTKCSDDEKAPLSLSKDLMRKQESLTIEKESIEKNESIDVEQENLSKNSNLTNITLLQDYEFWKLEFDKWKNEKNTQLYKLFHIIESCSKSVLDNSANAFLKYLSLHQYELVEKHSEIKKRQNQIISFFKDSAKSKVFAGYLTQYQKWFDETFHRIIICRTLILQNEQNSVIQESPRLPSSFADNRAEFNNLLTFYLGATDRYNKLRDDLMDEENKLNDLNRNFIKQIFVIGSLDGIEKEDKVLSDFSQQLDIVNQLKLAIEQEFEAKLKIKEKLTLLASPEIVKFYLSRIDPYDADSLKNTENHLLPIQAAASCVVPMTPQESNVYLAPAAFYYLPQPVIYPVDVVQPQQLFYSM